MMQVVSLRWLVAVLVAVVLTAGGAGKCRAQSPPGPGGIVIATTVKLQQDAVTGFYAAKVQVDLGSFPAPLNSTFNIKVDVVITGANGVGQPSKKFTATNPSPLKTATYTDTFDLGNTYAAGVKFKATATATYKVVPPQPQAPQPGGTVTDIGTGTAG